VTSTQIDSYKDALRQARADFEEANRKLKVLSQQGYIVSNEIARLRRTITALSAMCSEQPLIDTLGITDACIEVMQTEQLALTTEDVVRKLEEIGFDVESQKHIAASVHATLTRLAMKGNIKKRIDEGKTVTWLGPNYNPPIGPITDEDIPF
jgi:chromosome segregation ATPase